MLLLNELRENELIRIAAALEQNSEHPISTGIIQKAKELSIPLPRAENFNAIPGQGVKAMVEGRQVMIVSPGYLKEKNLPLPENLNTDAAETTVFVLINDTIAGYILLTDAIRPESADAIQTLHENRLNPFCLPAITKLWQKQ